jgi:hypothetical protein
MNLAQIIVEMLGDAANAYTPAQILNAGISARHEVEAYCRRSFPTDDMCMNYLICRIAVIRLQRSGTEGLASQSYSGVSESFIDGYPADILAILNSKRKVKLL